MPDFLLELRSEEIPARMQARARAELEKLFRREMASAGIDAADVMVWSTPRRLALIARGLPDATAAVSEEAKGPPEGAPDAAIEGFCRKNGVTKDQLQLRDAKGRQTWFAVIDKPGRATKAVLADAIPAIVRDFAWPKSMRWGAASISTESPRWVRPLNGIVAIFGEELVECEAAGVRSGYATEGHRFHHDGPITIGGAHDYAEKLRACHVIVDHEERAELIRERARKAAAEAGLMLVEDEGLVIENAGLTEWPVPLLGRFDETYLDVPPEVIQLTARTNQKYFVCTSSPSPMGRETGEAGGGVSPSAQENPSTTSWSPSPSELGEDTKLANAFICTANIAADDGGAAIVDGNRKVLAARLSDARFFWEQDRKKTLAQHAEGLERITFHERLGTVADKVERVAKLARRLVEEGIVKSSPSSCDGEGDRSPQASGGGGGGVTAAGAAAPPSDANASAISPSRDDGEGRAQLAKLAEQAARLCKADLVTEMVGEFPELQGLMGGYYARAEGLPDAVADAIRDHYKPVGQGDQVPTAPVTVAVSLADKMDTLVGFFAFGMPPTGSKDPFGLRRAALSAIRLISKHDVRILLSGIWEGLLRDFNLQYAKRVFTNSPLARILANGFPHTMTITNKKPNDRYDVTINDQNVVDVEEEFVSALWEMAEQGSKLTERRNEFLDFFADRLKVQQREAGVCHDLIDAVFALGGEDDLVRLLARVKALQSYIETAEGADLLAAYKRAANILRKENWPTSPLPRGEGSGVGVPTSQASSTHPQPFPSREGASLGPDGIPRTGEEDPLALVDDPDLKAVIDAKMADRRAKKELSYTPEPAEKDLIAALDSAEPKAAAAVEAEDFEGAMAALASLRAPIDRFFDEVTVNDPDPAKRAARLDLLARFRDAVHRVADFSRIEG